MVNMKVRKFLTSDYALSLICAIVMFLKVHPW